MSVVSNDVHAELVRFTVTIVSAHLARNDMPASEVPDLIQKVYEALSTLGQPGPDLQEKLKPAISAGRSVTPDYIVCLEDGIRVKMLKRHIRRHYGMSPDEYREKWGLPDSYPMVAPNYSSKRSQMAKAMGFGGKIRPAAVE